MIRSVQPSRPAVLAGLLASALFAVAGGTARADGPVSLVLGYTAGGSTDTIARILAPALSERLGQSIIVEDKPGAAAQIASRFVARAAPDGRVLQLATQTSHAVAPTLYGRVGYDPVKDFTPIALVAYTPMVLVANTSFPPKTVGELVEYIKARPGEVTYATGGRGDGSHLAALSFDSKAGLKATDVPYQGDGAAMPAVLGGHVPYMFCLVPTASSGMATGRIRALAVTSKTRVPSLPEVPTMAEAGLPDFEAVVWWGVFGPAGMAPELVAKLNKAVIDSVSSPEVSKKLQELGYQVTGSTPQEFATYVKAENEKWSALLTEQGLAAK